MAIIDLFRGIAVIIDDEVEDEKSDISQIITQIQQLNIPFLPFSIIPDDEIVNNIINIPFLLLDWDLFSSSSSEDEKKAGIVIPNYLKENGVQNNIDFIKKIKEKCFCPIFIFSKLNIEDIKSKLEDNNLYSDAKPNIVLIKSKDEIIKGSGLLKEIEDWTASNSSIYVMKEWDSLYQKSKNKLFSEFLNYSQNWPQILWNNFGSDGVDKSTSLIEFITQNLLTRMNLHDFDEKIILCESKKEQNIAELKSVLEGQIFLKKESLNPEHIATGDLFYWGSTYYLNIRASCDLIYSRKDGSSIDEVELYLIRGKKLPEEKYKAFFSHDYGHFKKLDCQAIVLSVDKGKVIDFRFNKLEIHKWGAIKEKRIGRILPPYIIKIQQKYASYFHRQGLPRIPSEAI